jgi:DNA polymerase-4
MGVRVIFHIDLNQFFCTCEEIKNPLLKGKAFVVGGGYSNNLGVVSSASYKAREKGVRSGMSILEARKIIPNLIERKVNFELYQEYSAYFFKFLKTYTTKILIASIDEAYLDLTEYCKIKDVLELAEEIQSELVKLHNLPTSIGIGPTLFLAKMASDLKKPLGITLLRKKDIVNVLLPLKIESLFGIGKKSAPLLKALEIQTIGDFLDPINKEKILTLMSERVYNEHILNIKGESNNIVDSSSYSIPKSISTETTSSLAIDDYETILDILLNLYDSIYPKLKSYNLVLKNIGYKLKLTNFQSYSKSRSFSVHTDNYLSIKRELIALFDETFTNEKIRLVGVFFSGLIEKKNIEKEYNLFTFEEMDVRDEKILRVMNEVNKKYPGSLKKGVKVKGS